MKARLNYVWDINVDYPNKQDKILIDCIDVCQLWLVPSRTISTMIYENLTES